VFKIKNDKMNSNRKKTIIAGALYIIGTIAGILSIAPAIDAKDYLIQASANANQVLISALFQFIMTIAYVCFAITIYPLLKKYKESLALGFEYPQSFSKLFKNKVGVSPTDYRNVILKN
jgi:uncharacterized membrane protein